MRKSRHKGQGTLPQATVGSLEQKPVPYQEVPVASEIPWSEQAEHKRETHWGEEIFSHKSNFLQFVFQQQVCFQFRMPLFKTDLLPSTITEALSFFSDTLLNIYQYNLPFTPSLALLKWALGPCQHFPSLDYCYVFHLGWCAFSCDLWGDINIYNWTVNMDK